MRAERAERIWKGQGTRNWVVSGPEGLLFAKEYDRTEDLSLEREALRLSEYVRKRGVSAPRILATCTGDLLAREESLALFEFVSDCKTVSVLGAVQMEEAGAMLGRIHRVIAKYPTNLAPETPEWLRFDPLRLEARIRRLLACIDALADPTAFDLDSRLALDERLHQMKGIPALIDSIRALRSQVLHGDYSSENLLFEASRLRAVVDFCPPRAFLLAYELGRAALQPELLREADWQARAAVMVRPYLAEYPAAADQIRFAPRVWLIQLLRSLYGVMQHYGEPHELQADLDRFWLDRAHAASVLLAQLAGTEELFADVAARS